LVDPYVRPFLDAQCWITALSGQGPYADDLREVLQAADRAELVIVASVLMPLEVLGGHGDERTEQSAQHALQALSRSSVVRVAISTRVVEDARSLRIKHSLKSMDALHLACAAAGSADAFLSNDDKLVNLGHHRGVRVQRPEWPGDFGMQFEAGIANEDAPEG
jgi:predicted nucleic acid-binding protein